MWTLADNCFTLHVPTPKAKADPRTELWGDKYIRVYQEVSETTVIEIQVDRRRKFDHLLSDNWIALFFGTGPPRKTLKGVILWKSRRVVLTRYGQQPRSYLLACR